MDQRRPIIGVKLHPQARIGWSNTSSDRILKTVRDDLKPHNLMLNEALNIAPNQPLWKLLALRDTRTPNGKEDHTPRGALGRGFSSPFPWRAESPQVEIPIMSVVPHGRCDAGPTATFPAYTGTKLYWLLDDRGTRVWTTWQGVAGVERVICWLRVSLNLPSHTLPVVQARRRYLFANLLVTTMNYRYRDARRATSEAKSPSDAGCPTHTHKKHTQKKTKKIVKIINIHYKEDASPFTNSPIHVRSTKI